MANITEKENLLKPLDIKGLYKRLFKYSWKYKYVLFLSVFSLIILSLTNTAFLVIIKQITDQGFVAQSEHRRLALALILLGVMFTRAFSGLVSNYSMDWVSTKIVEGLRCDAFKSIMHFPMSYFDKNSSSFIVSKITYDTEQLSNVATKVILTIIKDGLTITGIIAYMLYLDWQLTLIFSLLAPLMALYLTAMSPRLRLAGKNIQETMGEITMASDEAISGQRIVKIFGSSEYEILQFSKVTEKIRKTYLKLARLYSFNSLTVELLAAIALSSIVFYSFGKFTAGEFAAFFGALLMLIAPIKNLTAVNDKNQVSLSAAQSVFGLIDQDFEIDNGVKIIKRAKGDIDFNNVSFKYENTKNDVLRNINLSIKAGEKIALVGKSGGGKTTLVNLIPKFYNTNKGNIFLDGMDIKKLKLKSLRDQFSLVSQDTILFNDTVFNNIAYGNLNQKISKIHVKKAAIAANAWEFIDLLPNKLDHQIGDRGVRLSGGQRQRIAIARAILKDAPILLLDEATSALDSHSEKYVQAALDNLMKNRTTIVIAHRLSTVLNADRIVVIEKSEIVDSGTHRELMKRCKHYSDLYKKGLE
ncbi:MAG: lipid A export permease/ATP-binding protein MsbA [Candidatus Methylopumilus sp.]|nr:lipid A export permease/ATP-binding protein MsbA [Candidatus Methylopumilus sp.]